MAPKEQAFEEPVRQALNRWHGKHQALSHLYILDQLEYLANFLEKAGLSIESHSNLKNYPEAAGVGSGAVSGAYAWVRSMISINGDPSPPYDEESREPDHG